MGVVVSGGSGFLGAHLCEALLTGGDSVWCLDDFSSEGPAHIAPLHRGRRFAFEAWDVTETFPVAGGVDAVVHLASPAENMPRLADCRSARFVDDPVRRRPVVSRARGVLGRHPRVSLEEGLRNTVDWFAAQSRTPARPSDRSPVGRPS